MEEQIAFHCSLLILGISCPLIVVSHPRVGQLLPESWRVLLTCLLQELPERRWREQAVLRGLSGGVSSLRVPRNAVSEGAVFLLEVNLEDIPTNLINPL